MQQFVDRRGTAVVRYSRDTRPFIWLTYAITWLAGNGVQRTKFNTCKGHLNQRMFLKAVAQTKILASSQISFILFSLGESRKEGHKKKKKKHLKGLNKGSIASSSKTKPRGHAVFLCMDVIDTLRHKGYFSSVFGYYLLHSNQKENDTGGFTHWKKGRGRMVTSLHRPH